MHHIDQGDCKCDQCVAVLVAMDQRMLQEEKYRKLNEKRLEQARRASQRYYERHKEEVLTKMKSRYRDNEEFRQKVKQQNLARYHGRQVLSVGNAEVVLQ